MYEGDCRKCEGTGFVDRTGPLTRPPAMTGPAWSFWRVALEYSEFCKCPAGQELLSVFRLESAPPDCVAPDCGRPAVIGIRGDSPLCEAHGVKPAAAMAVPNIQK